MNYNEKGRAYALPFLLLIFAGGLGLGTVMIAAAIVIAALLLAFLCTFLGGRLLAAVYLGLDLDGLYSLLALLRGALVCGGLGLLLAVGLLLLMLVLLRLVAACLLRLCLSAGLGLAVASSAAVVAAALLF